MTTPLPAQLRPGGAGDAPAIRHATHHRAMSTALRPGQAPPAIGIGLAPWRRYPHRWVLFHGRLPFARCPWAAARRICTPLERLSARPASARPEPAAYALCLAGLDNGGSPAGRKLRSSRGSGLLVCRLLSCSAKVREGPPGLGWQAIAKRNGHSGKRRAARHGRGPRDDNRERERRPPHQPGLRLRARESCHRQRGGVCTIRERVHRRG